MDVVVAERLSQSGLARLFREHLAQDALGGSPRTDANSMHGSFMVYLLTL